jgi:hypothetical protein
MIPGRKVDYPRVHQAFSRAHTDAPRYEVEFGYPPLL